MRAAGNASGLQYRREREIRSEERRLREKTVGGSRSTASTKSGKVIPYVPVKREKSGIARCGGRAEGKLAKRSNGCRVGVELGIPEGLQSKKHPRKEGVNGKRE